MSWLALAAIAFPFFFLLFRLAPSDTATVCRLSDETHCADVIGSTTDVMRCDTMFDRRIIYVHVHVHVHMVVYFRGPDRGVRGGLNVGCAVGDGWTKDDVERNLGVPELGRE